MTTLSDQIRNTLRDCGEPMSLAQLADANSWDQADRAQAGKNLYNLKKSGEVLTEVAEGKVHYRLDPTFKRYAKIKKRGAGIHVAKADGARAAARPVSAPGSTRASAKLTIADDVARDRVEIPVKEWRGSDLHDYTAAELSAAKIKALSERAAEKLTENVQGHGLSIINIALSAPAVELLDALVARGLHGFNRSDAAQRLICRALEAVQP